ncbi:cyclin-like protein [Meira miltonrushii]|uniref:Cyclin-like protein n=1 Tax=Meira miltonrushii TaxID=1280837 RepID=A0A316V871_9BASI|nr:cyclin-like protein [Meira miltonrushii]PWN31665.1 cyclin-like protein [Meira miltonrushii]
MTSNYWVSTQCNHWILNQTQLAIARAEDLHYAANPEEYTALRIWLINCICLLTKRLSLRQRITATSIVFFHRFYSCSPANSFSSTDPSLVATACVYVASKVEETPVHIRNVVQEASKLWAELGHWKFPNDVSSLAEMEFYLLEDLQFHLIVYHPYRSLMAIHSSSGKGATKFDLKMTASPTWTSLIGAAQNASATSNASGSGQGPVGSGDLGGPSGLIDPELAYGSPGSGLSGKSADSAKAPMNGDAEKIRQLDRQSQIRMAWFVLNDTYRTDVLLLYPPHLVAVAAIFLAFVLHDPTRERLMRSKRIMDDRRERYKTSMLHPRESKNKSATLAKTQEMSASNPPVPPPDAMTFLAALNVDLGAVGEIVQEMLGLYDIWHKVGNNAGNGPEMFRRLTKMRERRREDLLKNGAGM